MVDKRSVGDGRDGNGVRTLAIARAAAPIVGLVALAIVLLSGSTDLTTLAVTFVICVAVAAALIWVRQLARRPSNGQTSAHEPLATGEQQPPLRAATAAASMALAVVMAVVDASRRGWPTNVHGSLSLLGVTILTAALIATVLDGIVWIVTRASAVLNHRR